MFDLGQFLVCGLQASPFVQRLLAEWFSARDVEDGCGLPFAPRETFCLDESTENIAAYAIHNAISPGGPPIPVEHDPSSSFQGWHDRTLDRIEVRGDVQRLQAGRREGADTNFIGIPKEPTGSSNDAKATFSAPKFRDAVVKVGDQPVELRIRLN